MKPSNISKIILKAFLALFYHVLLISLISSTYILDLFYRLHQNRTSQGPWLRIWLPSSTDPAPLFYPTLLPLLAAWSINSNNSQSILINFILSYCALPRMAIPFQSFYIHWLITLIPLLPFKVTRTIYRPIANFETSDTVPTSLLKEISLVFPLYCALTHTLGYLTTTSLLPTELHLLSISLINLLGVPKTPQSTILKALIWVGGLGVLTTCAHVSKWSVELARVPTWRFRGQKYSSQHSTLFNAIDDTLGGFISRRLFPKQMDSSDEDLTENEFRGFYTKSNTERGRQPGPKIISVNQKLTTLDDLDYGIHKSASSESKRLYGETTRPRRHTLPTQLTSLPDIPALTKTATDALSSVRVRSKLFLRLTRSQATVLKWLYAVYVYIMVLLLILIPVRLYVQYFALNGNEPVGWALGYLLGDNQAFRLRVIMANLDRWICLPPRGFNVEYGLALAEYVRFTLIGPANTRLLICAYCMVSIIVGLAAVINLSKYAEVDTRRKVFHGMMVAMFLPTIFVDPAFIALSFALILAIFLLLDLFRAAQLPPISKPLTYFLAPYVDGRDHKGPIVISHIFLLIGCAIPLWLSLAAIERTGSGLFQGWELEKRDISMITGVICVGMGDAAASLIGRRYGHRRWPWSGGKSLEGSAAFTLAVTVGLTAGRAWLLIGGWAGDHGDSWPITTGKALIAACGASLTEAVLTGGNDNVIVPVILWLLTRGLKI
jgi:dolichol kinase